MPPLAAAALSGGGLAVHLACPSEQQSEVLPRLMAAAQQCTLLTAALQPLTAAATLEAAAAAALEQLQPGEGAAHPLRVLVAGSSSARAPAERFLRHRLQQLGLGVSPAPGKPPLWCIQLDASGPASACHGVAPESAAGALLQHQEQAGALPEHHQHPQEGEEFLIALELVAGQPPPAPRRLGPTAMLPELAALSASLASVSPHATVLDPFCGSGSLLAASLQRGAALAVGSDIDDAHFDAAAGSGGSVRAGLSGSCVFMKVDAAQLHQLLPAASVDAILTDLPYGYRTTVGVADTSTGSSGSRDGGGAAAVLAGAPEAPPELSTEGDWRQLLGVLLRLAAHVLVPGGRLLVWLPCQAPGSLQQQQQELVAAGSEHALRLLHFLPESRQSGYPRAVALFQKQAAHSSGCSAGQASSPGSRQAALLAALQATEATGTVVHRPARQEAGQADSEPVAASQPSLPAGTGAGTDAALHRRGMKYKAARAQASGASIDVWR